MNIVLTIEADSFDDIAHLFSVGTMIPTEKESEPEPAEVEPEAEAPKPRRQRQSKVSPAVKPVTSEDRTEEGRTGPTATTDASPSDAEPVTFADLRAKTDEILQAGKIDSRAIQNMLIEKFDGAKAFGQVKEEDYARCLDELDKLAA